MSSPSLTKASEATRPRTASASSVETITQPATQTSSRLNHGVTTTSNSFFNRSISNLDLSMSALAQQTAALRSQLRSSLRKLETINTNTSIQITKINADIAAQEAGAKAHFVHRETTSFEVDLEMLKSLLVVKGSLEMLLVVLRGAETFTSEEIERMSGSELAVQLAKVTERTRIVAALEDRLREGQGSPKRCGPRWREEGAGKWRQEMWED